MPRRKNERKTTRRESKPSRRQQARARDSARATSWRRPAAASRPRSKRVREPRLDSSLAAVPLAGTAAGRQTSLAVERRGAHTGLRVRGTEFIGQVTVPTSGMSTPGTVLFNVRNQPNIAGSRVAHIAAMYQRWHPIKYTYRFVPTVPTSTNGLFVHAQDPDPVNAWVSSTANVARLRAAEGAAMRQCYEPALVPLPSSADYTSLWVLDHSPTTTETDRLSIAGQYVITNATAGMQAPGFVFGSVELDYDILFYVDRLGGTEQQRETVAKVSATKVFMQAAKAGGLIAESLLSMKSNPAYAAASTFDAFSTVRDMATNFFDPNSARVTSPSGLTDTRPTAGVTVGEYQVSFAIYQPVAGSSLLPFLDAGAGRIVRGLNVTGDGSCNSFATCTSYQPIGANYFVQAYVGWVSWIPRAGYGTPVMLDMAAPNIDTATWPDTAVLELSIRRVGAPNYLDFTGTHIGIHQSRPLLNEAKEPAPSRHAREFAYEYNRDGDRVYDSEEEYEEVRSAATRRARANLFPEAKESKTPSREPPPPSSPAPALPQASPRR